MRGSDVRAGPLFSYVDLETRVRAGHPLRAIRVIVNEALAELSPVFAKLYAPVGRPGRRSAIDGRTTRHLGYQLSQRARKRIEEAFGWIKTSAGQARTRLRGIGRVRWSSTLAAVACDLIRLPEVLAEPG